MGLVYKPPLPNGVVNPQQPHFSTQCGVHGRWTDPNAHRHTPQLLDDSASLPPLREQQHQHHHQLAHVSQLMANMKSHTKITFSQEKNCSKCTFAAWPTGGSLSYHHTPEEGRRTLPSQQWGTLWLCSQYPLHSQGEGEDKEESHNQSRSSQIIPKMGWRPKTER